MVRQRSARRLVLALLCALGCSAPAPEPAPSPTIVVISLDTLRPDRLGLYGNRPGVSPRIDALAARSLVFDDALAPAPWTLPSHMSLLSGLDPVAHGVRGEHDVLHASVPTLAELLRDAGYATAGFTDGGFVAGRYGFARGFDRYEDQREARGPNGFRRFLPEVLAWIDARGDEPFFLFVHSFDVHADYANTDPEVLARFREQPLEDGPRDHFLATARYLYLQRRMGVHRYGRLSELLRDYDAGVHVADRGVGAILDRLEQAGRLDEALVIVTSDHGESFLERGPWVGHGLGLGDDELAIPLLIKLPEDEGGGRRVAVPVDLLDVVPTVLDVAAQTIPRGLEGESLRALARGDERTRRSRFGESSNTGAFFLVRDGMKYVSAARDDAMTLARTHLGPITPPPLRPDAPGEAYAMGGIGRGIELRYDAAGDPLGMRLHWSRRPRLYDRRADPGEERDLHAERPELASELRARLAERLASSLARAPVPSGATAEPENGEREALEALGYLAAGGGAAADALANDPDPLPPEADLDAIWRADRQVHALRLRIVAGDPIGPEALPELERAEASYRAWLEDDPDARWRAEWRLREAALLAERAGLREAESAW